MNRLYNKFRTNRNNGVRRLQSPTFNKLCASSHHDPLDRRRCNPQARPSTSFVDHTIDLPWHSFLVQEFGAKFQRRVRIFWRYPTRLRTLYTIGQRKHPLQKPARSVKSFWYNRGLRQTDRRDGQTQGYRTHRASIALHGKNVTRQGNNTSDSAPDPVMPSFESLSRRPIYVP